MAKAHEKRTQYAVQTYKKLIQDIEEALREGYAPPWIRNASVAGAIQETSDRYIQAGKYRTQHQLRGALTRAKRDHNLEPDWSLWRPAVYQRTEQQKRKTPQVVVSEAFRPEGKPISICVIGDAHDSPALECKERFRWIGKWVADRKPDCVIQLGDWATFDSMSRHTQPGTIDFANLPSWQSDLESLQASVNAFEEGMRGFRPKRKVFITGNHENRAALYENSHPQMVGALTQQWRSIFLNAKWRVIPYSEYHFEGGVGFVHHITNGLGRAVGGKTGNQRSTNDSVFSIVHGHDHVSNIASSPKIGPVPPVEVISAGCCLPWGHVEEYAKLGTVGWYWGVNEMSVMNGQIIDFTRTSMLTLEDRYGHKPRARSRTKPRESQRESPYQ